MEEVSLKAEQLINIGGFILTNGLLLAMLASLVLIVLALLFSRKIKMIPGKVQGAVEMGVEAFLNLMSSVLGSREAAEKYFPLVATIFIFVLTSNWLGLFPGVGSFVFNGEHGNVPLLRSPAADLNFTLALAVIAVLATNFFGLVVLKWGHIKKFINFSSPINFFVGILEAVSELSRIVSFSFRLFGNVFAGEILLMIMFVLVPYIAPIPFMMMEMFVGLIQAFIFSTLTLVFLSSHIAVHDEGH